MSDWRPGFHDNSLLGWLITAGYAVVTLLCVMTARRAGSGNRNEARLWATMAVGLFLLGVNKQLDLQDLLRGTGRDLTLALGIYEHKFLIRLLFLALLTAVAVVATIRWRHLYLVTLLRKPLLVAGLVLLAAFIALSSLHPKQLKGIAFLVVTRDDWQWTLEAGALLLMTLSATIALTNRAGLRD